MAKNETKERTLTPAEQRRQARFEAIRADYEAKGYQTSDLTAGIVYANVMALVLTLPIAIVLYVLYVVYNGGFAIESDSFLTWWLLFMAGIIVLTVVHEGIHGLVWGIFAREHMKSIEFGFIKESLTPYCTCAEPLTRGQYIAGTIMPLLLLGIVLSVAAIFLRSPLLFALGIVMTLGGGGDLLIIVKLLRHRGCGADVVYMDHPTKVGLVVFEKPAA